MSASHIPNLNTLRRGGGRGRFRSRGGGQTGDAGHGSHGAKDRVVQGTDNDASVSRLSAVNLGYLDDVYAPALTPPGMETRRLPIINRGTYVRTTAIDRLVTRFLNAHPSHPKKQIISLGAGTDTRIFRLLSSPTYDASDLVYHEIDFPVNTSAKIKLIRAAPLLQRVLSSSSSDTVEISPTNDALHSPSYHLHPLDLRNLPTSPALPGLDPTLPTLLLSECCLIYLTPSEASLVVRHFTETIFPATTPVGLVLYEPIRPDDAFGRTMVANLATRGIQLQTLQEYASLGAQRRRLREMGLDGGQAAADVDFIWERWATSATVAFLAIAAVQAAKHAHDHGHHRSHRSVDSPVVKKSSSCQFPSGAGLIPITPHETNGGWAMSPDQECKPGGYCPYACPAGQVSMQWDPEATSYTYPMSMNGGLYCDENGEIQKPFPDRPYCKDGTGVVSAKNKCKEQVSFCQTVLPGNEAMLIPTLVEELATLAVPDLSYWCETAAHFYINPPGYNTETACVWGTSENPYGNWSPYVAGANTDGDGNTYVKLGWNPIYLEPTTPFRNEVPEFGVEIECEGDGCNGLPCKIDPSVNGVNEMTGDSSVGAGGASFCVVTVPKGGKANVVVFDKDGGDSTSISSSAALNWTVSASYTYKPHVMVETGSSHTQPVAAAAVASEGSSQTTGTAQATQSAVVTEGAAVSTAVSKLSLIVAVLGAIVMV
ncbi:Alg9-like mannosyltransferase family protein [Aspergillus niger]|uniref:Alg9-like mannosyltransferase family protein n=1 Tax=Aspergillus niger TaxID=5061 RepID=A0A505HUC4_ASPNG|nr:Alg9-like mannosyltransferase family protein [Aspergillus niger]